MHSLLPLILCTLAPSTGATPPSDLTARIDHRANVYTTSDQDEATVAGALDGSFVVAWHSRRQNAGRDGVLLRRFGPNAHPIGSEVLVGSNSASSQRAPSLTITPSGTIWVAFQEVSQSGSHISLRLLMPDLSMSETLPVDSGVHAEAPAIASLPDSGAVISWTQRTDDGLASVRYRVFAPDGSPRTPVLAVAVPPGAQRSSSIAGGPFGFAIAWIVLDPTTRMGTGAIARAFDFDGSALDDAHAFGDENSIQPALAAITDGYAAAWLERDGDGYAAHVRTLDATGAPTSSSALVSQSVSGVDLAVSSERDLVVGYTSLVSGDSIIKARRFDDSLNAIGEPFTLAAARSTEQAIRKSSGGSRLAFTSLGHLLCAWSGDAGLQDSRSANVSVLSSNELPMLASTPVCPAGPVESTAYSRAEPHVPPVFNPLRPVAESGGAIRLGPDGVWGFDGVSDTGWMPPDSHMALGPTHVMGIVNGSIRIYRKNGKLTFESPIEGPQGFWGELGATDFVFDPEVAYDTETGRFVAMASEGRAGPDEDQSFLLLAMADDDDPNGQWHKYRIDTTASAGDILDSPNLAITSEAVVVIGKGNGTNMIAVDKASMLTGAELSTVRFSNVISTFPGISPTNYPDPGVLYMVTHGTGLGNIVIEFRAILDPLNGNASEVFELPVEFYGAPDRVPQAGTSVRLTTFDHRFWSVAYIDGSFWLSLHSSMPTKARWYEVAMNGWPNRGQNPSLVQSGIIDPGPGIHAFFPSIDATAEGLAAVTYSRSSPDEFVSIETAYRLPDDPPGTMPHVIQHQTSVGPYERNRWGDYSGTKIDPMDNSTIWSYHEYAIGDSWRTWFGIIPTNTCRADLTGNGTVDSSDFFRFLDLFAADDPLADFNMDGVIDSLDFFAFLDLFVIPCE